MLVLNSMKKRYMLLFILLMSLLTLFQFVAKPMIQIFAGFSAKTACSCHFIQGRSLNDILKTELSPADFIHSTINTEDQSVHSSLFGVGRTAVYRPKMGCTLVSEKSAQEVLVMDRLPNRSISGAQIKSTEAISPELQEIIDQAFQEPDNSVVNTRAILIMKDSSIIAEQYAPGFSKETPLMGWSMTKSVTNALVGILVKQGKLDIYNSANIADWHLNDDDPRRHITIDHLLRMSSGLYFEEEYENASTVNKMLWTKADAGKVAYSQESAHPADTEWYYSSGTTNIISHLIRNEFNEYASYIQFPYSALFEKLGMTSVIMETDSNGTYVGSSLMYATARDWAIFGQFYLQDGVWNDERILPEGWVEYSKTPSQTVSPYNFYGAHFWINAAEEHPDNEGMPRSWPGVPKDAYYASGFEGQTVMIIPSENMVIVRLGQTLDRSAFDIGEFAADVLRAI